MGTKSGIVLDIGAMCNLAVKASKDALEITDMLDTLQKQVAAIREDDSILSGGQKGEEIANALNNIEKMSRDVASIVAQIKELSQKQVNQMAQAVQNNPQLQSSAGAIMDAQKKISEMTAVKEQVRGSKK